MPPRRSVVDHSAPATSTESIAIQVSGHEETIIDPVIQATSHRRQTGSIRGAAKPLSEFQYGRIYTYLTLGWAPKAIARTLGISPHTVWSIERNMMTHGSMRKPQLYPRGRRKTMALADEDAMLQYLLTFGWRTQEELVYWLEQERDVEVSRSTISRTLKRRGWNQKELRRISMTQSEALRHAFLQDMSNFEDRDLVFLDESIFNEKTGWRHRAYAPVGHEARYVANVRRGDTYAIIAAMTLNGWLPCTAVKKGYYSKELFVDWLKEHLIPTLKSQFSGRIPIVVLDNCSIHTNLEIERVLEESGCLVRYLPPYSPDFNPIELTFNILKAWMRKNWVSQRENFTNFGDFLWYALEHSKCDRFAKEQLRHAADGVYCEGNNVREFYRWIERWELEVDGEIDPDQTVR